MPVRFLIADDYRAHQRLLAHMILLLGGEWTAASDGREALQLAEREEFDVILMDMQMPGLGGIAAADHLIELWAKQSRRSRIVAVTGDNSEERRALCRAVGMDGFIAKPFEMRELGEALQKVMMRGHCWEEGPPCRLLNRAVLHHVVGGTSDEFGMRKFEAWADTTPTALRSLLDVLSEDRIEEIRASSTNFGFVGLDAALAALQVAGQASAVWLVDTARDLRMSITAARASLREPGDWAMAA